MMQHATLPLIWTTFGELELTNAMSLRLFRKELLPSKVKAARALVQKDIADGILSLKPVPAAAFERAKQIARRRTPQMGTRALDVLHVACALILQADSFFTFDRRQESLARAEGLTIP
jgi:predicted nucleic acid-binding protein